jgi:hypothetical protein
MLKTTGILNRYRWFVAASGMAQSHAAVSSREGASHDYIESSQYHDPA